MTCEICGRKIHGPSHHVSIDGAKLIVCSKCAAFSSSSQAHSVKFQVNNYSNKPSPFRSKPPQISSFEELELVEDYGKRIKKARETLGLSQKELGNLIREKASFLQKLETYKTVPNTKLAKKLEKRLKIVLLVKPSSLHIAEDYVVKKPLELTLGDLAKFKKKRESSEDETERAL